MTIALAFVASDQDLNKGAIPGYTECGGCRILASRATEVARDRGLLAAYFEPTLESVDDAEHTKLQAKMTEARVWLDKQTSWGNATACVHVHTNAAAMPEQGESHTGYCYSDALPGGRLLGKAICERLSVALGLPVQEYDYSAGGWLFDTMLRPHPSLIVEVTRHDRKADLERLYASVEAVASALVDGALDWAKPATAEIAALQRQLAEVEALNARYHAALQATRDALVTVGF